MLSVVVAPVRKVVRYLLADSSPGQVAVGFMLGMNIGFVPKGNLIALSLFVLMFSMRCHKGIAIVAAIVFSCVAPWADPFTHKVGLFALSVPSFQGVYASFFDLPFGPWFGFNNTIVAGSLLLSLYLSYPAYWITRVLCTAALRGSTTDDAPQLGVET